MNKLFLFVGLLLTGITGAAQNLRVLNLQCESRSNPLAINTTKPALSWQIASDRRGVMQVAYRVLVSDDEQLLQKGVGNTWDSKKIQSSKSNFITYAGKPLKPSGKYFWKVTTWDNKENAATSASSHFSVGLLSLKDWSGAKWIGYAEMEDSLRTVPGVANVDTKRKLGPDKLKQRTVVPLFGKTFNNNKQVSLATIYISGLGHYELSLNGQKVGNSFLAPGWTHYDKRVLYNAYDITAAVKRGENAIGVIVGNGFYNINRERYIKMAIAYGYPKMICKLVLKYTDGSSSILVSDASWKTAASAVTFTSLFGGEEYDANLEQKGWDNGGFRDSSWKNAVLVSAPRGPMETEMDYPVTVKDVLSVKSIVKPKDSVYVYDFAQNLSGIVELKVQGKKGQVVKLSPAELLHTNGLANQNATGRPYYFSYTLKGDGVETWRPRFTYTGFRYVQVEGGVPDTALAKGDFARIISLASLHTSNSAPSNGKFECSNKLFNDINGLIKWAIQSNLQSVATDCPHREKLSWLEQDYLMGNSINANFNVYQLFKKIVYDMMDAQTPEGLVPDIAPEYVYFDDKGFGFRDSPEWGSASVIVPWLLYKWYGDVSLLEKAYPMMKKYVAFLKSRSTNNILDYGLGDWFDNGPNRPGVAQLTPKALTATAIYYHDVQLLSQIAATLNEKEDASLYSHYALEIHKTFRDTFFNPQAKVYSTGSQTGMAMPLSLGLVEEADRTAVMKNLVDSINASGKKLTAGDIGFHFLMEALHSGGASQLIYEMNYRDDVPGYGYQLKKGATALTESWPALEEVSNNHLMLGHIMQWFYEGLGGIGQSAQSIGFREITIKPEIVGDISFVNASHETVYGKIVSSWKKSAKRFELTVSIPPNTKATIFLPATKADRITENNQEVFTRRDMKFVGFANGRAKVEIGSGNYSFTVISE
jgi:hypothetical protein